MPSRNFGVQRSGVRITELPAAGINTGITFAVQVPGLVSFYEEHDAMIEANHTEESWQRLSPMGRAEAVASYRLRRAVKLHQADALNRWQERKNRRARRGR
jgi:hypothetical protein